MLGRAVLTPADLERHDPNLVGGDSIAGSMHLRQNFVFRPFPAAATTRPESTGLLMIGAATWPGAGVNAISGYNVAQQAARPRRPRAPRTARLALSGLRAAAAGLVRGGRSPAMIRRRDDPPRGRVQTGPGVGRGAAVVEAANRGARGSRSPAIGRHRYDWPSSQSPA